MKDIYKKAIAYGVLVGGASLLGGCAPKITYTLEDARYTIKEKPKHSPKIERVIEELSKYKEPCNYDKDPYAKKVEIYEVSKQEVLRPTTYGEPKKEMAFDVKRIYSNNVLDKELIKSISNVDFDNKIKLSPDDIYKCVSKEVNNNVDNALSHVDKGDYLIAYKKGGEVISIALVPKEKIKDREFPSFKAWYVFDKNNNTYTEIHAINDSGGRFNTSVKSNRNTSDLVGVLSFSSAYALTSGSVVGGVVAFGLGSVATAMKNKDVDNYKKGCVVEKREDDEAVKYVLPKEKCDAIYAFKVNTPSMSGDILNDVWNLIRFEQGKKEVGEPNNMYVFVVKDKETNSIEGVYVYLSNKNDWEVHKDRKEGYVGIERADKLKGITTGEKALLMGIIGGAGGLIHKEIEDKEEVVGSKGKRSGFGTGGGGDDQGNIF